MALTRLAVLLLLIPAACSTSSEVAELAPEVYGLTAHGNTPAAAAQLGVAQAQRHCADMGRDFEVTRSTIGARDYTIAFRCPRPQAPAAAVADGAMPHLPPLPEVRSPAPSRASRAAATGSPAGGFPGTQETF